MPAYISEWNVWSANGGDFVEIAVPVSTDVSGYSIYVYDADGAIVGGPYSLGAVANSVFGQDVYVIDAAGSGISLTFNDNIALVDDNGTVLQFLASDGFDTVTATEGPANGLTSQDVGRVGINEVLQSTDGGGTYTVESSPSKGTIPCFAPGTLIQTPDGEVEVEKIKAGMLVRTIDGPTMQVHWTHSSAVAYDQDKDLDLPILIRKGALGKSNPSQDLIVSSQHKILVGVMGQLSECFPDPRLVPAKALIALPGIRFMKGKKKFRWHHFAFEKQAIVIANGCAAESLLVGPMVVAGLDKFEIAELHHGFLPTSSEPVPWNGPLAQPCLSVQRARNMLSGRKTVTSVR